MNFLNDLAYWSGIAISILIPLMILVMVSVAIVRTAIYFAPVNVRDRQMDRELAVMLHESR
jgi:hypothetical protein